MPSQSPLMLQQQQQQQQQRHQGLQLQGPRPATLKVSSKQAEAAELKKHKRRPPVIIYVESPRVVHAHPSEFKSVVQRLTGAPPPSSSSFMTTTTLFFPQPSLPTHVPPAVPLQFPFQLPLVAGTAAGATTPASTLLPADAAGVDRSFGFFSNTGDQSMVAGAGGGVQAMNPCFRHGDRLFVNQQ